MKWKLKRSHWLKSFEIVEYKASWREKIVENPAEFQLRKALRLKYLNK